MYKQINNFNFGSQGLEKNMFKKPCYTNRHSENWIINELQDPPRHWTTSRQLWAWRAKRALPLGVSCTADLLRTKFVAVVLVMEHEMQDHCLLLSIRIICCFLNSLGNLEMSSSHK